MNIDAEELDFLLPSGDDLRVFLNQESITDAALRRVLRRRGIYVPSTERAELISFLLFSFLNPSEFGELLQQVRQREESEKERSIVHSVVCDAPNLEAILPAAIDLHKIAVDGFGNSQILGAPELVHDPQGKNDSFIIRFKNERKSVTADWLEAKRVFEGSIRFTLNKDTKVLVINTEHTSAETERICRKVRSFVEKDLRERSVIGVEPLCVVNFGSFTNEERILFFMAFTKEKPDSQYRFQKWTDLALKLDDDAGIPHDKLKWMSKKVSVLKLRGAALHETFFVTDVACHPYVIFWKTILTYDFTTPDHSGYFHAVLEFGNYGVKPSASCEFQISVEVHIDKKSSRHRDYLELSRHFRAKLLEEKQQHFSEIIDRRKKANGASQPTRTHPDQVGQLPLFK